MQELCVKTDDILQRNPDSILKTRISVYREAGMSVEQHYRIMRNGLKRLLPMSLYRDIDTIVKVRTTRMLTWKDRLWDGKWLSLLLKANWTLAPGNKFSTVSLTEEEGRECWLKLSGSEYQASVVFFLLRMPLNMVVLSLEEMSNRRQQAHDRNSHWTPA